jgi:predicted O-methyltransferase YrrM
MEDSETTHIPSAVPAILQDTQTLGFRMASEPQTGSLLRCLAASKPAGRLLELGTGTGLGTAWLLAGMDPTSTLETVDNDDAAQAVARKHLAADRRVRFHVADGGEFLRKRVGQRFDLIFADAWPGKFHDLDLALSWLAPGGLYVIDDLLPQPSWPEGHAAKVPPLIASLEANGQLCCTRLAWATGIMIVARRASDHSEDANRC